MPHCSYDFILQRNQGGLGLIQGASLVAQLIKNLPAVQETLVQFLGQEDPLEKSQATHSHILGLWASLVAQTVRNPPTMQEIWVQSPGWEDPRRRAWQPIQQRSLQPIGPQSQTRLRACAHSTRTSEFPVEIFDFIAFLLWPECSEAIEISLYCEGSVLPLRLSFCWLQPFRLDHVSKTSAERSERSFQFKLTIWTIKQ